MENNYKHIVLHFDTAQKPVFVENKSKGWVTFGVNNDYPKYLLDLFSESPKHGGIVKTKCVYSYGKGFETPGQANGTETWNDILRKVVKDDELYRGFYFQIIWNREKKIKDIYHLEFHKVRTNADKTEFYVKNDWSNNREKERVYPAFNVNNPVGAQIFYYKEYNPLSEHYPVPSYFQGLNMICADIEVSRSLLGNAKQGFSGSKLINLNNGDPINEEHKGEVEKGLLKKFTGSEGKRVVIMFNKSKDNAAEILDLGASMLTKEDFTNVNNLIQSEILTTHQVTSPVLFGISTPGALGQRNELRDAFELFSKTYVSERQQVIEEIITKFRNLKGEQGEFKIMPIEPLSFEFSEQIISQNLTKDEIREVMGKQPLDQNVKTQAQIVSDNINALSPLVANKVLESMTPDEIRSLAGLVPAVNDTVGGAVVSTPVQQNEAIRNLSGRQYQNVMRIVRQFGNGKLTKQQATLMLKNGFGFTDDDVNTFLGIDDSPLTDDEVQKFSADPEVTLIQAFSEFGESRDNFEILMSTPLSHFETFANEYEIDQLQANILGLYDKDKRITPEVIAKSLKANIDDVNTAIKGLIDNKIISVKEVKVGVDKVLETKVLKPASELPGKDSKVQKLMIRYSYEWRNIPGNKKDKKSSRPFCVALMESDKLYSRADIETLSARFGYSVFDRCGGFWNNNGVIEYQCRHEWRANIVTRKK
ncbi:MAG: hypothetical protein ACK5DE_06330 [Bacteroidota bacterium]|jgi:hypothetical protein